MEELEIHAALAKEDLFSLFKQQLKKDFESAGVESEFINDLPVQLAALKLSILTALQPLLRAGSTLLPGLLYRIDISEAQLKKYGQDRQDLDFAEILSELIIKRILQKVILKKKFSG